MPPRAREGGGARAARALAVVGLLGLIGLGIAWLLAGVAFLRDLLAGDAGGALRWLVAMVALTGLGFARSWLIGRLLAKPGEPDPDR